MPKPVAEPEAHLTKRHMRRTTNGDDKPQPERLFGRAAGPGDVLGRNRIGSRGQANWSGAGWQGDVVGN